MKKTIRNTTLLKEAKKNITKWENIYETEVNGEPTRATVIEEQTEQDGHEINTTTIKVGETTKTRYTIDRRELENRIDETATEEEDRIDQEGGIPGDTEKSEEEHKRNEARANAQLDYLEARYGTDSNLRPEVLD